ncbi:MAG: DnaJ domain-containing protein [bacterium]|nr:DnaJ domain-containing protein [bacterium]MXV90556.1 DnaJ domain-containing protein [Acidimicrobiia bacterium]MYC44127.1 DnaJ domain-containing protein [Acidimicrobiia bacterium]
MNDIRQEWLQKDYYRVLGVSPDAPQDEVTKAYRSLARQLHPDRNPDDARAEERFKEVSAAYDVVGDADKRAQYDEIRRLAAAGNPFTATGPGGTHSFQFSGADGLNDLLANLFGGAGPFGGAPGASRPQRGPDHQAQLSLSFDEAVNGTTREVALGERSDRHTTKVRIPAGVCDGQRIRLRGKGGAGSAGGPPGDLYVIVRVGDHSLFGRDGDHLTLTVPVSFSEAAQGARLAVPTFDGEPVTLRLPAGTQSGRTLRVRGRGVKTDRGTGDLLVTVEVVVPQKLNAAQRRALKDFEEATKGPSPREHLGVPS